MLDGYIYSNTGLVDRLVEARDRTSRSSRDAKKSQIALEDPKGKEKKDEAVVRRLEGEMDKLTDLVLLHDAQEYQKDVKDGTRSFMH
ncbi:uncharacterized protein A1O5_06112 [Cladophialophora psammophila CBS 110553]|uniref:Uncharacterized protein n=1 Tax=Cladophialophora psammophila CBS 110553 TaxID=1182543 RepID=W9XL75_9EURO|nr:uncharacterized protein A1O5_06112 [Cladophialophora psammophila CBS 110553]EXJ71119.1 hypothetical protein A1O5_06112 [Cladophialophora psammophila CBS 110553]